MAQAAEPGPRKVEVAEHHHCDLSAMFFQRTSDVVLSNCELALRLFRNCSL
jgi:hypothetical protein